MERRIRLVAPILDSCTNIHVQVVGQVSETQNEFIQLAIPGVDGADPAQVIVCCDQEYQFKQGSIIEVCGLYVFDPQNETPCQVQMENGTKIIEMGDDFDLDLYSKTVMLLAYPENDIVFGMAEALEAHPVA